METKREMVLIKQNAWKLFDEIMDLDEQIKIPVNEALSLSNFCYNLENFLADKISPDLFDMKKAKKAHQRRAWLEGIIKHEEMTEWIEGQNELKAESKSTYWKTVILGNG